MSKEKLAATFIALFVVFTPFQTRGDEYLKSVRSDYDTILIAKILSGDTVETADGYARFFPIRPRYRKKFEEK